jgi:hypothetical protein
VSWLRAGSVSPPRRTCPGSHCVVQKGSLNTSFTPMQASMELMQYRVLSAAQICLGSVVRFVAQVAKGCMMVSQSIATENSAAVDQCVNVNAGAVGRARKGL